MRRWGRLFPPRDKARQVAPVSEEWIQARLKDARWVATVRERLQSLSWFMECLKEPLSRLLNREEQTRGAFFEGRFKSEGTETGTQRVLQRSRLSGQLPPMPRAARKAPGGQ